MDPKDRLAPLLAEAARTLGLANALPYPGGAAWRLAFDEHTALDIEYDEGTRRLMVSSDVGVVAEHLRARMLPVLLQYNFLWTETGGVRMALDGEELVVAMLEVPECDQEGERFATVLADMAGVQRAWALVLDPGHALRPRPPEPPEDGGGLHFAIKA